MFNEGILISAGLAATSLVALGLAIRARRARLRAKLRSAEGSAREMLSLGGPADHATPRYKHISVWIGGRDGERTVPLLVGHSYTLNFKVGLPVPASLVPPKLAKILASDIPEEGLDTEWVVLSPSVHISPLTSEIRVTSRPAGEVPAWRGEFALHVPRAGESSVVSVEIIPLTQEGAALEILIFVRGALYRRFDVELNVAGRARVLWSSALGGDTKPSARVSGEVIEGPATQIGPQPACPPPAAPGEVTIAVLKRGGAYIRESLRLVEGFSDEADWHASPGDVSGRIDNLREAAEQFRSRWEDYLNNIDSRDLLRRLCDGTELKVHVDQAHVRAWREVAASEEMRQLAFHGYALYQAFFPQGTDLRRLVDSYDLGWRLNIKWQHNTVGRIPHVPWGLMYRSPAPKHGVPVVPADFLGLRFRISYTAHAVNNPRSFGLGDPHATFSANFMYWGGGPGDPIRTEALWQQEVLGQWPNQVFVPGGDPTPETKDKLLSLLDSPNPPPTPVLYIFCQCEVGQGNRPVLRFGPHGRDSETVNYTDLSVSRLEEQPLVFFNACLSSAGGAYTANELERMFFERGCSAYIGTETYMPVQLASRFATVFYNYFYRRLNGTPMPAGEALFQARHFLWRHYHNLGGLLYSYVNRYDLFMATDEEVEGLIGRRRSDG